MNINFGKKAKDIVTGFSGIITGHCAYISGCAQYLIVPNVKADGTAQDGRWFDEQRVIIDNKAKQLKLDNGKTPGADLSAPIR
jgi:hypothetical protein